MPKVKKQPEKIIPKFRFWDTETRQHVIWDVEQTQREGLSIDRFNFVEQIEE